MPPAVADSGASSVYISVGDSNAISNVRPIEAHEQFNVRTANSNVITPYAVGTMVLPNMKPITVHVFQGLSSSLISVGHILDELDGDGEAVFEREQMQIRRKSNGKIIIIGVRCPKTKLYTIDLHAATAENEEPLTNLRACAATYAAPVQTVEDLVTYWYQTMGSPVKSTLLNAVKQGYLEIPEMPYSRLSKYKHLLRSPASAKGHLDLTRQGTRSTDPLHRPRPTNKSRGAEDDEAIRVRILSDEERISMDLTAKLHDTYIMVIVSRKTNYIRLETSKSRHGKDLLAAFESGLKFLRAHGAAPSVVRMDNEISADFRLMLEDEKIRLELAMPHNHRSNDAERAIRTSKNHIIASLATADPDFPMAASKHLLAQAETTLNLLRRAPGKENINAWQAMHGRPYDFNAHPLGPPGTRVVAHDKQRTTWGAHGQDGWYVGGAPDHYRAVSIYFPRTRSVRVTESVSWHFHDLTTESSCSATRLEKAVVTIKNAIAAIHPGDIRAKNVTKFDACSIDLLEQRTTLEHILRAHHQTAPRTAGPPAIPYPTQVLPPAVKKDDTIATPPVAVVQKEGTMGGGSANEEPAVAAKPSSDVETAAAPQRVAVEPVSSTETAAAPQRVPVEKQAVTSAPLVAVTPALPISRAPRTAQTAPTAPNISAAASSPSAPNIPAAAAPPTSARGQQRAQTVPKQRVVDTETPPSESKTAGPVTRASKRLEQKRTRKSRGRATTTTRRNLQAQLLQEHAQALMVTRRFRGKQQGGRERPAAPTERVPKRRPRRSPNLEQRLGNELWNERCEHANTAVDLDEDGNKLVYHRAKAGPNGHIWEAAAGTEITKLIDSKTGRWIHVTDIPKGRKAAYYNPRCRTKIKNGELVYRVRGTIGGDKVDYDGDTAAYTASMQAFKILCNSIVSTEGGKFASADIKDYYLGTPLVDKHGNPAVEYMRISLDHIPADVQALYDLEKFAHKGFVYMEIAKSIYGLPQSGRQAQDRLVKHLKQHGYYQCANTPSLFRHTTKSIAFTLVVDDFGIKYVNEEDLESFHATLRELYEITEDRGLTQKIVGITITHDREANTITLSMPGYVRKALERFNINPDTAKGANSPAIYEPPDYGAKIQYDEIEDDRPISAEAKTRIQQIVGVFLFYARAVDPTMLCAVNKLASKQAAPTVDTVTQADRILQYAHRYPNAAVTIRASDMQLRCHSDASYLSEAKSRSRAGGILFLGAIDPVHGVNGAIDYLSCIISTVAASATEAEYASLFLVGREATGASHTLIDLGHPQTATLIICDNKCAVGIANRAVKQKASKSINMRYHWIRDKVDLDEFIIEWEPGSTNLADYFTKNHPVHHHQSMRNVYVHDKPAEKIAHICVLAQITHEHTDINNYYSILSNT